MVFLLSVTPAITSMTTTTSLSSGTPWIRVHFARLATLNKKFFATLEGVEEIPPPFFVSCPRVEMAAPGINLALKKIYAYVIN
jgi:hypothetical protein